MKRLTSIFTDDMNRCMFTGSADIERHHVFPGRSNRPKCEKYGFVAPVRKDLHPNGTWGGKTHMTDQQKEIDIYLRKECQKHYEKHHGTREQFISEFGKNYL